MSMRVEDVSTKIESALETQVVRQQERAQQKGIGEY
jgi:hypothetical protein